MTATDAISLDDLPGEELIRRGLRDAASGIETVESLLVEIARPRLERCGMDVAPTRPAALDAEIRLYRRLGEAHGRDAYGQYNALMRRLVSFERALEHRWWSRHRAAGGTRP
jgi:hypothetical protein